MFTSESSKEVTLLCENELMRVIIDHYGEDAAVDRYDDTEPKTADTAVTESDESDAAKILELLKNPETAAPVSYTHLGHGGYAHRHGGHEHPVFAGSPVPLPRHGPQLGGKPRL